MFIYIYIRPRVTLSIVFCLSLCLSVALSLAQSGKDKRFLAPTNVDKRCARAAKLSCHAFEIISALQPSLIIIIMIGLFFHGQFKTKLLGQLLEQEYAKALLSRYLDLPAMDFVVVTDLWDF